MEGVKVEQRNRKRGTSQSREAIPVLPSREAHKSFCTETNVEDVHPLDQK